MNIFCTKENESFKLKLLRLSKSNSIFKNQDAKMHSELLLSCVSRNQFAANFIWCHTDYLKKNNLPIELIESSPFNMLVAFQSNNESNTFFTNLNLKNLSYCLNKLNNLEVSSLFSNEFKEHHMEALALSLYRDVKLFFQNNLI